ncbi:MAG: GNAT family N-acetyltransferase [Nitrolancea sp.]
MIVYQEDLDGITADQLDGFFAGWPDPPTPETHLRVLRGSDHVVLAIDDERGHVVGFVTAISDGVLSAYIPLLEVQPEWQGRDIGSELMRRMLERLKHLYMIDLVCDPELQPFYRRFEMQPGASMMLRHLANQSGT